MNYKRVLLKISGEALAGDQGFGINPIVVKDIAEIFGQAGVSIDSLITCKKEDNKYEIVIRGDITNIDDIKAKLEAKGYKVIHTVKIG